MYAPRFVSIWVYPRVCGGTLVLETVLENEAGLSPRVRGNLLNDADS